MVTFAAVVSGAPRTQRIRVGNCAMHPIYVQRNAALIRPSLLDGRSTTEAAIAFGDQCRVLETAPANAASHTPVDVAVLTLERPVPPPGSVNAPGDIFVSPLPLWDRPLEGSVMATAVGYGITAGGAGDAGTRRFRAHSSAVTLAPIIESSRRVGGSGDSGSPLLAHRDDGLFVVGVASTGFSGIFPNANTNWVGIGSGDFGMGGWIRSAMDRNDDGRTDLFCPLRAQGIDSMATPEHDQDGDGHLDVDDSCPTVFNPCQLMGDADGDGVPDDCDACPADPSIMDGWSQSPLPDDDHDGFPNVCDCSVFFESLTMNDVDGDGSTDGCDNCRTVFNPDQQNSDRDDSSDEPTGDTWGDACDNCPFHDNQSQTDNTDAIRPDGIGNVCDNCEDVYNPLQTNCNLDAERALNAPEVGDACDPIPCGETRLMSHWRDEPTDGVVARVLRQDTLEVDGVVISDSGTLDAVTGFRFCPCSTSTGDDVESREFCKATGAGLPGCTISDVDSYNFVTGRETKPWRLSSIVNPDGPVELFAEPSMPYSAPTPGIFNNDLSRQWNSRDDRDRWSQIAADEQARFEAGEINSDQRRFPGEENQYAINDPLPGVLWTHTPGTAGALFSPEIRRLSSHYWSGAIAAPLVGRRPFPCLRFAGSFVPSGGHFAGVFPPSFIGTAGDINGDNCEARPEPPLLVLPELPVDLAPVIAFDPGPLFRQPDLKWLTPSEPVGRWPENHAALVAFDGNDQLAVRLEQSGQGLVPLGQGQGQGCPPYCDTVPFPIMADASTGASIGTSTSPAAGESPSAGDVGSSAGDADAAVVHVLSATRDIAWSFMADGRLRAQGIRSGASSERLIPALDGRQVEAATYRAEDDRLYVLTTRREWLFGWWPIDMVELISMPALFSIDPTEEILGAKVERTWPTIVAPDHFALVAGADGSLWTFGSHADHHFVLRLEQRRTRRPRRRGWRHRHDPIRRGPLRWVERAVQFGDGALTDVPMRSDERGVSLVVEQSGLEQVIGYRHDELRRFRHRHLRRCF